MKKSSTSLWRWQPSPLERPKPNSKKLKQSILSRILEVLRYLLLSLEYLISPEGSLRAWLKLNVRIFIALLVPIALGIPLLTALASLADLLCRILINLLVAALCLTALSVILASWIAIRRPNSRQN